MTSEQLFSGLKITVIGMGIVFVSLYLMNLLLVLLGVITGKITREKVAVPAENTEPMHFALPAEDIVEVELPTEPSQEVDFGVMVALSAALAAAMGSRPVNIVSIRKEHMASSPWQQAGRSGNAERQHN